MSLRDAGHDLSEFAKTESGEKSLAEHGLCFGSALAILAVLAFALQWLIAAIG